MAIERASQTGETEELAYYKILTSNQKLYARYNQERADAARGTQFEASLAVHGTRQQRRQAQKRTKATSQERRKK
jgi:hypothetical protein